MEFNFLTTAVSALIPLIMGFIWYGPILFQNAWMKEMGFTKESMQGGNMALIFGLSYVLSFLMAFVLQTLVIHQFGAQSVLMGEPGFTEGTGEAFTYFQNFMAEYGDRFRTFGHGALHGAMIGLLIVLPVMGTNALFEKKSFKYVMINAGYWTVTIALMGGILCQTAF
ncbi:hypothetical protein KCTC32516_00795 [Polaribacter huanghezhanensis]|uniref:DUF1761 domain-containing protein n=1 Tax=Polaribacter huanghezhanensis TaxID=1354726 RepID=UPI002649F22C|nr:DUF1761 domain-containing protein [Polaribacter huanghezhanensis]WKD85454.1 hypothetical protein KCTC32516_00795 [Polaribacter huanghezhanensis]